MSELILRTVYLYGSLADDYVESISFPANQIDLLISGICIDYPDLFNDIRDGHFNVMIGGLGEEFAIDEDDLLMPLSEDETEIHIYPVIDGEKSKFGKILIGAAVIGASIAIPAAWPFAGQVSTALLSAGSSLVLQGATAFLADTPSNTSEEDQSIFTSSINNVNEGGVVPVVYGGLTRVQGTVVDLDISADEVLQNVDGVDILDAKSEFLSRSVYIVSEGEVIGPNGTGTHTEAQRQASVFVKDVPVSNLGSSDTKVHFRNGSFADNNVQIDGFTESSQLVNSGLDLESGVWVTLALPASSDEVKLNMVWPTGLYVIREKVTAGTSGFEVQVSVDGGPWLTDPKWKRVQTAQVTTSMQQTYRISKPASGSGQAWRIRIMRESEQSVTVNTQVQDFANSGGGNGAVFKAGTVTTNTFIEHEGFDGNNQHFNQFRLESYNLIVGKPNKYFDSAYFALEIPASDVNGALSEAWFTMFGIKVPLPNNYGPTSSAENRFIGSYTGLSRTEWTDNPAFILLDLIRNERYGHGKMTDDSKIDIASFINAAIWCDEFVSDGQGGQERRFKFDGQIATTQNPIKLLNAVASSFFGKIIIDNGIIRVVFDDENYDSVAVIDNSDVFENGFSYSDIPATARHTQVVAKFRNPQENYELSSVSVEHADIATRGQITSTVELIGCQRESQALRHAQWILETNNRNLDLVTWSAPISHANYRVGEIITIRDEHNRDANTVFDIKYRITGIDIGGGGNYNFQAIAVDEAKAAAYNVISIDPATGLPSEVATGVRNVGQVSNIQAAESTTDITNSRILLVSWDAPTTNPAYIQHYIIRHESPDGSVNQYTATQERYTLTLVNTGIHTIRVTAVSVTGNNSPTVSLSRFIDPSSESGTTLNTISNLNILGIVGSTFTTTDLNVTWDAPASSGGLEAFSHYVVRFSNSDAFVMQSITTTETAARFSFEENRGANNGSAVRDILVSVEAIDTLGKSSGAVTRTFTNSRPSAVSGFVVDSTFSNTASFSFTLSQDADVSGYKIRMSTSSNMSNPTIVFDGKNNSGTINGLPDSSNLFFQVGAYDLYDENDINYGSIRSIQTIDAVVNSSFVFEGFRAFEQDGDLKIVGENVIFNAPDGTVVEIPAENIANVGANKVWTDDEYVTNERRYYYLCVGSNENGITGANGDGDGVETFDAPAPALSSDSESTTTTTGGGTTTTGGTGSGGTGSGGTGSGGGDYMWYDGTTLHWLDGGVSKWNVSLNAGFLITVEPDAEFVPTVSGAYSTNEINASGVIGPRSADFNIVIGQASSNYVP